MTAGARVVPVSIGQVLDGIYRIERLLGAGSVGTVYEAVHLRLGTRVALKVMAHALSASPESFARFHRDAIVSSGLGHPHIVQVFDFSTIPSGEPFFVMELLEGEDLEARLRRTGSMPAANAITIIKQIASALFAAHSRQIVHRDLRPANIRLLSVAGEADFVKVLDFGISKVRASDGVFTQSASAVATPSYMAPEQALGALDEIDHRTDQWALACVAWECLSGAPPFVGDDVQAVLHQVVHRTPPPLARAGRSLGPRLEAVLRRALAKNRNDRFASVADFADALADAIGEPEPTPARMASASPRSDTVDDLRPWAMQDAGPARPDTALSPPSSLTAYRGNDDAAEVQCTLVAGPDPRTEIPRTMKLVETAIDVPYGGTVGQTAIEEALPARRTPPQPAWLLTPYPPSSAPSLSRGWTIVLSVLAVAGLGALLSLVVGLSRARIVESVFVSLPPEPAALPAKLAGPGDRASAPLVAGQAARRDVLAQRQPESWQQPGPKPGRARTAGRQLRLQKSRALDQMVDPFAYRFKGRRSPSISEADPFEAQARIVE